MHRNTKSMVIALWVFGEGGARSLGRRERERGLLTIKWLCVRTAGALQADVHCWVR